MKKISVCVLLGIALAFSGCSKLKDQDNAEQADSKMPVFALIDSSSYDFGTIKEGEVVEHDFKFRNDGEYPLILNNITTSCGCTTPEWPKDPIGPKQTSSIKVRFDSKNKSGPQVKTITVYANTEPEYSELRLRGIVNAVPETQAKGN